MLEYLEDALQRMHVEKDRVQFLEDFWSRREEFWDWQSQTLGSRFTREALPVFLHGGSTEGRVLIMGLNPGYQGPLDALIEETVQADSARYLALHEKFFDEYPAYQQSSGGTSPFWNNLYSKLAAMLPEDELPQDKWSAYRISCVAQDILPFRSTGRSTSVEDLRPDTVLGRVAAATLTGLQLTDARAAWLFSREGYEALDAAERTLPLFSGREDFSVSGCTRTGQHRSVRAIVAQLHREGGRPPLPMLAVDNALISQPTFPFAQLYCARPDCKPRLTMVEQLRARVGRSLTTRS